MFRAFLRNWINLYNLIATPKNLQKKKKKSEDKDVSAGALPLNLECYTNITMVFHIFFFPARRIMHIKE